MKPVLAPAGSRLTPALVATAWGLLAILILYGTLLAPSYYEDNRYNLGLVRRSALPTSQHLLETSLAHLYFQPYPLPRAEDWHLSLPLILLTGWTKLIGPSREWALPLTAATTCSPKSSCGKPSTAASCTAGCVSSTSSTSRG